MKISLLPQEAKDRKEYKVFSGLVQYFPNACLAVGRHSFLMNEQHNPGEPMHWARDKSIGTGDEIVRHLIEGMYAYDQGDNENAQECLTAVAWRSMELLERCLCKMPPFIKPTE